MDHNMPPFEVKVRKIPFPNQNRLEVVAYSNDIDWLSYRRRPYAIQRYYDELITSLFHDFEGYNISLALDISMDSAIYDIVHEYLITSKLIVGKRLKVIYY
jgi:hypothetical protein